MTTELHITQCLYAEWEIDATKEMRIYVVLKHISTGYAFTTAMMLTFCFLFWQAEVEDKAAMPTFSQLLTDATQSVIIPAYHQGTPLPLGADWNHHQVIY